MMLYRKPAGERTFYPYGNYVPSTIIGSDTVISGSIKYSGDDELTDEKVNEIAENLGTWIVVDAVMYLHIEKVTGDENQI